MNDETVRNNFYQVVRQSMGYITYAPLGNEVVVQELGFLSTDTTPVTLPSDASADPYQCAAHCVTRFGNALVCIFVPGRMFDVHGTRHGRGGGWYDRFLSRVPKSWIRVGVGTPREFSKESLARAAWDEPVDWVLIKDASSFVVYRARVRRF